MPFSLLGRWWHRVNRRFEPTYGTASRQDAKNTNTALPGFAPDSKAYETDSDSKAYETDSDPSLRSQGLDDPLALRPRRLIP